MLNKIFCFISGKVGTDRFTDLVVSALAEDGMWLASHMSSSEYFAKHDIGITSDWKHKIYEKYYPNGYELVWVDDSKNHSQLQVAIEKNQKACRKCGAEAQPDSDPPMCVDCMSQKGGGNDPETKVDG